MSTPDEFDMAKYDSAWGQAEKPSDDGGDFAPIPDGAYAVKIERSQLKWTKKEPKRPMISFGMKITEGDYSGRWVWKNLILTSDPQRMGWIKRDLAMVGVSPTSMGDLESELDNALDREIEVKLATKGEWQNVYFQVPTPPADDAGEFDDLDIPF